jgi:hypothetical protein
VSSSMSSGPSLASGQAIQPSIVRLHRLCWSAVSQPAGRTGCTGLPAPSRPAPPPPAVAAGSSSAPQHRPAVALRRTRPPPREPSAPLLRWCLAGPVGLLLVISPHWRRFDVQGTQLEPAQAAPQSTVSILAQLQEPHLPQACQSRDTSHVQARPPPCRHTPAAGPSCAPGCAAGLPNPRPTQDDTPAGAAVHQQGQAGKAGQQATRQNTIKARMHRKFADPNVLAEIV